MRSPAPLKATTSEAGEPLTLVRGRRRYRVTGVSEHWRITDEWWGDEVRRDYFRVETDKELVMDVYRDMVNGGWFLVGVL